MKKVMVYNGVEITANTATGSFYLKSPVNGTQRIFRTLEKAMYYIDHAIVLDSRVKGMHD